MMYGTIISMRRKRAARLRRLFLFLLAAGGLLTALFFFWYKPSKAVVSPIPQKNMFFLSLPILFRKKNPEDLQKILLDTIQATTTKYSIIVKDFQSDFMVSINPDDVFTGMSVNKLAILGALYSLVQKGDIDPDTSITLQQDDIQDYGTGSIRYDAPGTTYTVQTLAKLMIGQSDNTAAYILGRHVIGMEKIQTIIDGWGMAQTDMENNKTSNRDMEFLMEKIYREKVVNKDLTIEMLSFMKDGTIEDRIPAQLPKGTVVYHKTGNGVGFLHDVGIVVGPKTTYYIGLFTSGVTDEEETIELLATLSRLTYDFMK